MDAEEIVSFLSRSSIFSSLTRTDLVRLAGLVKHREYAAGEIIIHQGDFGDSIYFICRGEVDVFFRNREGAENVLSHLAPGDFFGEMALLTGSPRTASVRVAGDALILLLMKSDFDTLLGENPHLSLLFSRLLAERLSATTRLYAREVDREEQLRRLLSREEEQRVTQLVGKTRSFQSIVERIDALAMTDEPLTIMGPEGTATEDVARLIHAKSRRREKPFLVVDLSGGEEWRTYRQRVARTLKDPDGESRLFEEFQTSALFGHEPGAIAGAEASRMGCLELADGGTVVLKNVERLTSGARERLRFYLLEKKSCRLGAQSMERIDARIMATLSRTDPEQTSPSGLRGRMPEALLKNTVEVPSLSQRRRDIPLIAGSYLEKHSALAGKSIGDISPQALNTLVRYPWPGNDRELESVIERGVMVCDGGTLMAEHIFLGLTPYSEKGRLNLLRNDVVRRLFANTPLRASIQAAVSVALVAILALTYFGIQNADRNLGSVAVWYYWWPLLLISFLAFSRIYCSICPLNGFARYARKLFSFNLPAPKLFNYIGVSLAAVLGIGLFWAEDAFGLKISPARTAVLLLCILLGAVLGNLIFRQEVWCRYLCPLGFFCGVYSPLAMVELRANNSVCSSQCKSTPCYRGEGDNEGCPMSLFPVSLASNQFCKLCGRCVRNCRFNSIHLDLRWPGAEILTNREPHLANSLSILALLGMLYPLFLRDSAWPGVEGWLPFTVWFWSSVLVSVAVFSLAALAGGGMASFRSRAAAYGFTYLPLAFSGHVALLYPYLARGWRWIIDFPDPTQGGKEGGIQTAMISAGVLWSLWLAGKMAGKFGKRSALIHGALVLAGGATLILLVIRH